MLTYLIEENFTKGHRNLFFIYCENQKTTKNIEENINNYLISVSEGAKEDSSRKQEIPNKTGAELSESFLS